MSNRRLFAGFLAAAYLAAATVVAAAAARLRAPQPAAVSATASFACAGHHCSCRAAQQCQLRCCCFPKKAAPLEPRLSARAEDCQDPASQDAAPGSLTWLGPHLPPAVSVWRAADLVRRQGPETPSASAPPVSDPPEKVPLSAA